MTTDRTLADTDYVASVSGAAETGAVAKSDANAQSMFDDLTAELVGNGAVSYNDAEAFTYNAASPVVRVFRGGKYQLAATTPGGLAPLGVGDGSDTDQQLLVSRVSGHAAAAGCTGGRGGVVRVVTTTADDPTGSTVGSLRYHLNAHQAAWLADQSAAAWIVFDPTVFATPQTITLTADLNVLLRNITFDGRGANVTIDGGGKPGPVPYGKLSGSHTSGTTTITLQAGFNFNPSKLRVGHLIDVIATDGTRSTVYGSNLLVKAFDATAGTITLDASTPLQNTAPNGAYALYHGKSVGQLGYAINNGGKNYNDMFAPPKPTYAPAGNIIWHNISFTSLAGGDVMDTGDENLFRILNFTSPVWVDHCSFSYPDPFNDIMIQNGSGAQNITYSWCKFAEHYKGLNTFAGVDGTGGTNPDGTTSLRHPFPPIPDGSGLYSATNPGPYRFGTPPGPMHGNSQGLPVVVETVTYHHCFFLHIGNRGPKTDNFSELHLYNSYIKEWGLTSDPLTQLNYDWPPVGPMTGGSAVQVIDYASALIENVIFEPYSSSTGGALRSIATLLGNNSPGNAKMAGCVFRNGAVYDSSGPTAVNGANANKVPDFSQRYAYSLQPADALMQAQILAGAGAGKQSALWQYVGPASVSNNGGGTTITDNGDGTATGAGTLLTALPTAATVTASGTLVAGKHTPVDATAGTVALTLPTPARAGVRLRAELISATNTATITGTIRGVTTTLTLLGQYDQLELVAESTTSWRVGAQHRPKAVNDALYAAKAAGVPAGGTSTTFLRGDGTWAAPTGAVVAGQELAFAGYHPIAAQTAATTTSSTYTDIAAAGVTATWGSDPGGTFTATRLDCPFTVPPSRIVDVELTLYVKGSASGTNVRWGLADNTSTSLSGVVANVIVSNGTTETRVQYRRRIDLSALTGGGPAAGATFTLRPQWAINTGTGTIDVGGINGGISMRVYAAL